jgi:hypothetical protein
MAIINFVISNKDDNKLVSVKTVSTQEQYDSWLYALAYLPDYLKVTESYYNK